jgi:hypothetical protein
MALAELFLEAWLFISAEGWLVVLGYESSGKFVISWNETTLELVFFKSTASSYKYIKLDLFDTVFSSFSFKPIWL